MISNGPQKQYVVRLEPQKSDSQIGAHSELIWSNFPLFSFLWQETINISLNDFFFFFYGIDIFWIVTKWNNFFFFLYICCKIKEKKKLDTKEFFVETIRNEKFQKDITWLMEPSSDTKWCEPHDHMVTQPIRKDINSRRAK